MFVFSAPASTAIAPRRASGSLFDHLFADRPVQASVSARVPALDVAETDTAYTLAFDVPGVSKDQLKVSIQGRRVQLDTQPAAEAAGPAEGSPTPEAERTLYRERSEARYARTVALPAEVDQAGAVARYDNGVLTLRLPKRVPTGATQLSIS